MEPGEERGELHVAYKIHKKDIILEMPVIITELYKSSGSTVWYNHFYVIIRSPNVMLNTSTW